MANLLNTSEPILEKRDTRLACLLAPQVARLAQIMHLIVDSLKRKVGGGGVVLMCRICALETCMLLNSVVFCLLGTIAP